MPSARRAPDPAPVREQLKRILASNTFSDAERASVFLRFVVEEAIRLPGASIKESVIGVEVFGKDPGYDPKIDPVVRIYAGRVRDRLARYYAGEGRLDQIRIEIPKRSYVPEFGPNQVPIESSEKIHLVPRGVRSSSRWAIAGAVTFVAVLILLAVAKPWRMTPTETHSLRQLTFDRGLTTEPTLTRDGKLLAYASDRSGRGDLDIWMRQTQRGDPVRLTSNVADDREPDFSPDGTHIVFRSDRDGGGLYVMPALSGETQSAARRIADGGARPRFSPDGKWIAYTAGASAFYVVGAVFIVPAGGGVPRRIGESLTMAGFPVWDPDGRNLLVYGARDPAATDWWVLPIDGGPAKRTGVAVHLEQIGLTRQQVAIPETWVGDEVYFTSRATISAPKSTAQPVWKLRLNRGGWTPIGPPIRITQGSGQDVGVAVIDGGPMVFGGLQSSRTLHELKGDKLTPLVADAGMSIFPSLSADGRKFVYTSDRSGETEVWLRDLQTGRDTMLTESRGRKGWSEISPDGAKVAYTVDPRQTFVLDLSTRQISVVCQPCVPSGWSPDSRILALTLEANAKIDSGFFSLPEKKLIGQLVHPVYASLRPRFSPDGHWIAFSQRISESIGVLQVARWNDSAATPEKWIPVTEPTASAHFPEWSRDGRSIYYFSNRLGSFDLWKVDVDATGHRAGEPVLVRRLSMGRQSLGLRPFPFAVSSDSVVVSLEQTSGNLWAIGDFGMLRGNSK